MPPLPPHTFWERVAFHLKSDDDFRTAIDAFMACFAIVGIVSASVNFIVGLISIPFTLLLVYLLTKRRLHLNEAILMPAAFLGCTVSISLLYSITNEGEVSEHLSRYFFFLFTFHFTEFVFTALTNRRSLRPDSFLLNHSVGYWLAAGISWIEFLIEAWLFPGIKCYSILWIGTIGCIIGEICRKLAMVHAGIGFTHRLAMTKRVDHRLVKDGIYAYMRHPGYFGWFLWAISTQLILCNPICFIVYAYVTWQFFSSRIYDEEKDLIAFFGDAYTEYQQTVWIGVPFVSGYQRP
uniref:Protein-S-isoprenylcysteine O-methyltransferase n=1 Tax=Caenorhabditis tropicalis TaxID=1561998 RepID=A0A1I7U5R7_9PELO